MITPFDHNARYPRGVTCRHCGEAGGQFESATYVGAPEGGVPVHTKCLPEFFRAIDKRPYRY